MSSHPVGLFLYSFISVVEQIKALAQRSTPLIKRENILETTFPKNVRS